MRLLHPLLFLALAGTPLALRAAEAASPAPSATTDIPESVIYLQNPSAGGLTVSFLTRREVANVVVEYAVAGQATARQPAVAMPVPQTAWTMWKARLEKLEPGTSYRYVVRYDQGGTAGSEPARTFRTLDPKAKSVRFLAVNDLHHKVETLAAAMKRVRPEDFEFSVLLGDMLEGPADGAAVLKAWTGYMQLLGAAQKPILFVRGNHDTRQAFAKKLACLIDLPNLDAKAPWGEDQWQFTLRAGPVWFVALDTGEDDTQNTAENSYKNPKLWRRVRDREAEWLHQVAVRQEWAEARWRVFLSHIPLYDNNEWWCHDGRPKWEPILKDIAPDVMLAGHDHGWKLLPQTAAQPWPVLIGGGPSLEEATIMLVTADESALQARLLAAKDGTLLTEFKKSATVRP